VIFLVGLEYIDTSPPGLRRIFRAPERSNARPHFFRISRHPYGSIIVPSTYRIVRMGLSHVAEDTETDGCGTEISGIPIGLRSRQRT
jgi:hypothetical protein